MRFLSTRLLKRLGLGEDGFLLFLAVLIGAITGAAAGGFHELINLIRDWLYNNEHTGNAFLYDGWGMIFLVLFPALGGLAVGVISRFVFREREGHGVVDVVESVVRSSGFQKPSIAIEKILTSALTIGTGGSAGAEGPIVQIGAAISSWVGQIFRVARSKMPVLTGCGCAAGISAIFNAPFGGVLFTLEVILQDFSIRSFTPVVLASVIAQVTVQAMFQVIHHQTEYRAIFAMPAREAMALGTLNWSQVGNFIFLGVICGVLGAVFTRLMYFTEHRFSELKMHKSLRPALGGAMLGVSGVIYIIVFGHILLRSVKPFAHASYPMPAFFGDGYGVIQLMLTSDFYVTMGPKIILLLTFLCFAKMAGTCVTLGSGGSGGVIAPSVFIGATLGAVLGELLRRTGWFWHLQPEMYALVGMGAVLAAVVHAPLASILICFELTQDYKVMLPAMLACIMAVAVARVVYPYSVYSLGLRSHGVRVGSAGDFVLLRRIMVEQIPLDPISIVHGSDPLQRLLDLSALTSTYDFVVCDSQGNYEGMVVAADMNPVLMDRAAVPLLVVGDLMRRDIAPVQTTDDLAAVFDAFSLHDVNHLPVCIETACEKIIGLVSRSAVIRKYQEALKEV